MTKILPVLSWRKAVTMSKLPPTTRHVALTLSLYMNEMGGSAFPGVSRLINDTGLSDRAVRAHLKQLVGEGWLLLVERGGLKGEKKTANAYQAVIPNPCTTFRDGEGAPLHDVPTTPAPPAADPCTTFTPTLQELSTNSGKPTSTQENSRQRKSKRAYSPTDEFVPTLAHLDFAKDNGLSVDSERDHWLDYCAANGKKYVDHDRAFFTWLRNAAQWRGTKPVNTPQPGPSLVLPPSRVETCPVCDGSLVAHKGGVPCPS